MAVNHKQVSVTVTGQQSVAVISSAQMTGAGVTVPSVAEQHEVSVTVEGQQRSVMIGASTQLTGATVTVEALPVRVVDNLPHYTGEYIVEPTLTEQTLPTADTIMDDDVTVRRIAVSYTTNYTGGNTVYIGAV